MLLLLHHPAHLLLVVIGLLVAGAGALPQAVIPLGVKQALLLEPRLLEAVVCVGGQHKVVPVPHQLQQLPVDRPGRVHITVDQDVAAPEGPVLLQRIVGVKAARVHIVEAVGLLKFGEIPLKPLAAVHKARRGGKPRPSADQYGVRGGKCLAQSVELIPVAVCRWHGPGPEKH